MKKLLLMILLVTGCSQGQQGSAGATGSQGAVGPQGPAGSNGTAITIVQFCPGVTPSYPTTFPEIAFCINNSLYAVYSQNDGFMTEIIPGTYLSNAVGSSCTFMVQPNCVIVPQ